MMKIEKRKSQKDKAESRKASMQGGVTRSSEEAIVMIAERRGGII